MLVLVNNVFRLANPVQVKPGDEIVVDCVFDSTRRTTKTKFGEGTSDEMCFGFLAYYPAIEGLGVCAQNIMIDLCPKIHKLEPIDPCDLSFLVDVGNRIP